MQFKLINAYRNLPVKGQLLIGLSVLGTTIIAIIGFAVTAYELSKVEDRVERSSSRQTAMIAKLSIESLIAKDRPALKTIVEGLKSLDNGMVRIELTDRDGDTLVRWTDPGIGEDIIESSEEIYYYGQAFGTVSLAWTYDYFAKPILAAQFRSMVTTFVTLGFLIIAIGAGLKWYLVQPLEFLENKVRAVAERSTLPNRPFSFIARELRSLDESLDRTARALTLKAIAESKVLDERSRAETAEAAAKTRMDFLSLMSHEIRTPLGAMIGFGRLLTTAKLTGEEREFLDNLNASGRFLLTIINDILDLSKIEANGIELETRPLQLGSVFGELEQMVKPLADDRSIELDCECEGLDGKQIYSDPHRLKQVLMNLVGNAVKFTEDGGVTVRANVMDSWKDEDDRDMVKVRIEVSDSGIGMSEEQCQQIFDPFSQADSGITRKFGGTGLGLSIASQLVSKMGGQIEVTSELGVGSTFSFEAPFHVSDAAEVVPRKRTAEATYVADQNLRILIAEDEPVNRILIEKIFASLGHEVEFAENGQLCVDRLRRGMDFDVLFLDLHMPHLGGFDVARMLRAGELGDAGKDVNLVIMSADVLAEEEGRSMGIDAFISKPVDPALLKSFLRSISSDSGTQMVTSLEKHDIAKPKTGGPKVLVVDDQQVYRNLMNHLLGSYGLDVSFAEDGIDCLEYLDTKPELDAIFLDLRMPRMDGRTVARKIREGSAGDSYADIPIAVVSAEVLESVDFEQIGADEFFPKPIDMEDLQDFVAKVKTAHPSIELTRKDAAPAA